jgi:hypothetical protein
MFDKLRKLFAKPIEEPQQVETQRAPKPRKPKEKLPEPELTLKEKATQAGEPYINILSMDIDPDDINTGAFELDWNEKFIMNLIRAGYKQKDTDTDTVLVDRWFQNICRNIALEVYEQQQADPTNRPHRDSRMVNTKDLGNGKTEVS